MKAQAMGRPRCAVCEHQHVSARLITVVKENGKEFHIILCAMCALMFAGVAATGCDNREVNRAS